MNAFQTKNTDQNWKKKIHFSSFLTNIYENIELGINIIQQFGLEYDPSSQEQYLSGMDGCLLFEPKFIIQNICPGDKEQRYTHTHTHTLTFYLITKK